MDSQRLILAVVFAGSLFMLYQKWIEEHTPKPVVSSAVPTLSDKAGAAGAVPTVALPAAGTGAPVAGSPAAAATAPAAAPNAASAAVNTERVSIKTDFLIAEIDGQGGTLTRLELVKQRDTQDPAKGFVLLEQTSAHTYVAQSGLIGEAAPEVPLPNHKSAFAFSPGPRELKDGEDKLEVRLEAKASGAVKVAKVFVFHRASYVIDVRYEIANQGKLAIRPFAYYQLTRDGTPSAGQQRFVSTFTGPAFYTDETKYGKFEFAKIDKGEAKVPPKSNNGWVAIMQHYFVAAWLPAKTTDATTPYEFYAKKIDEALYSVGVVVPAPAVAPGATAEISVPLYAGPEEQDRLAAVAPGLGLVVDYGWLTIIAAPLFKVLEWLHAWVNNWGVAIILLTCLIKALFYPLSAASYKSMARMRVIGPRMLKLREQYGDDRMKLNQATMELYKTEKINPLGGCLPILVQIPVFISLYWVLLASVEMRNAPFALWIHDLSSPDPFYVLPVIMTATSYIQIKLNPTPPDPVQAKVMLIMPLAFGVMFFFFPAGLVLYWVVNNVLSIAQQWQITRTIEGAKERAKR